jgi:phospholipase D1/2
VLIAGKTCWRVAKADRAAFLIDADAYFSAFRHAVEQAQQSILIVGWDIDSRTPVGHPEGGPPLTLLELLNDTLARRPGLQVHALGWDFSVIYTFERERLPAYRFAWSAHPRLAFELDGVHPIGASHHQKIVVVDDTLAFSGGLDLTIRRWDTPAHGPADPRRVDPAGRPYAPMHDVQVMVEGDAAAALGDLVRARWRTATGKVLPPPTGGPSDALWPRQVEADLREVPVGIARTIAPTEDSPGVREVLEATLAAIAGARRWIYIESQYLTSAAVGTALARRLGESNGPEIVAVLPRQESGWLEQSSMGILRTRLLRRLVESDRYGRLRLCYPTVPELGDGCLNVHSKVLIADDEVARIGSANLSNRSMGLDSECDLVFDAALDRSLTGPIADLRDRLLAEHLGTTADAVASALRNRGSLVAVVDELAGQGLRTLLPLPLPADNVEDLPPSITVDLTFLDGLVCDPERPGPDQLIETIVPPEMRHPVRRSLAGWALVLAAVLAIVAAWRLTPLASLLDVQRMTALGRALRHHPGAPAIALGAYLVGGLVLFPITLLLAGTALVFPAGTAVGLCLVGTLAGAAETYGIGRLLGRYRPRALEHPRFIQLERQLRRRGFITIIAARMLPVGNFSLINMTAGALRIPFRDYMLGNALGVLPGILGLTVLAERLGSTVRQPRPINFVLLFALAFGLFMAGAWLRRRLRARR